VSERVPTKRQYRYLRAVGNPALTVVVPRLGDWKSHLRWGWVEDAGWAPPPNPDPAFLPPLRVTPSGLRALALAVEKYGYPSDGKSVPSDEDAA
jgi:hypothetical protein